MGVLCNVKAVELFPVAPDVPPFDVFEVAHQGWAHLQDLRVREGRLPGQRHPRRLALAECRDAVPLLPAQFIRESGPRCLQAERAERRSGVWTPPHREGSHSISAL